MSRYDVEGTKEELRSFHHKVWLEQAREPGGDMHDPSTKGCRNLIFIVDIFPSVSSETTGQIAHHFDL